MMRSFRGLVLYALIATPLFGQSGRDLVEHIRYLADDDLRGRGNYMPELDIAAEYLAEEFRRYGLEPAGGDGTYFQSFNLPDRFEFGPRNGATVQGPRSSFHLGFPDDYEILSFGGEGRILGAIAFAGYGISAPEYSYDDYRRLDVRGKIVLVLAGEPRSEEFGRFKGATLTPYSTPTYKIVNAREKGARAVILLDEPGREGRQEPMPVRELGIAAIRLDQAWGDRIFALENRRLSSRQSWIDRTLRPFSFSFADSFLGLTVDVERSTRRVRNVIGLAPGISDEVIVLGAHYDHVGLGHPDSEEEDVGEIHNGADDNASGTAGLLEMARAVSLSAPPNRGVLFIAFAGEELGLLGSRHFIRHPPLSPSRFVSMLNLDMIGRSRGELIVGGVGTAREFRPILEEIAKRTPLDLRVTLTPNAPSDHLPFSRLGIPVLYFFSGFHNDYHRPGDDWEKIDVKSTLRILEVVAGILKGIDALDDRPAFVDLRVDREPGITTSALARPVLGAVLDSNWLLPGVRIDRVLEQSPAFDIDLREGDVVIGFDGVRVDYYFQYSLALAEKSPEEIVDVLVLRDGRLISHRVGLISEEAWRQARSSN